MLLQLYRLQRDCLKNAVDSMNFWKYVKHVDLVGMIQICCSVVKGYKKYFTPFALTCLFQNDFFHLIAT